MSHLENRPGWITSPPSNGSDRGAHPESGAEYPGRSSPVVPAPDGVPAAAGAAATPVRRRLQKVRAVRPQARTRRPCRRGSCVRYQSRHPLSAATRNSPQVRPGPRLRRYAQTAAKPRKQDSCRGFSDPPCRYARAFKLIEAAQARWRAVNAPHLVALVRAGATFVDGQLAERPTQTAA